MGQKSSSVLGGVIGRDKSSPPKLPAVSWILRGRRVVPQPEQPIKFQYKTKRKGGSSNQQNGSASFHQDHQHHAKQQRLNNVVNPGCGTVKAPLKKVNDLRKAGKNQNLARTKSEPSLALPPKKNRSRKSSQSSAVRKHHNHHRHHHHHHHHRQEEREPPLQQFGYEIGDVDAFLTKANIEKPANIPVVLAIPTTLYQTRTGGFQTEIQLPLGMVVNAVFKNQNWLYIQTPHTEEGYVSYMACLPLGIIPPPEDLDVDSVPCWEDSTDVFPKPSGNMTDTEKLSSRSECSFGIVSGRCRSRRSRTIRSDSCEEESVDRLYLQAASAAKIRGGGTRQTLLVICRDYQGGEDNTLTVLKGDVVALVNSQLRGWFWVRDRNGLEGFIPAEVAGNGYL